MIFDLLNDLNQDCHFTDKIKESKYIEGSEASGYTVGTSTSDTSITRRHFLAGSSTSSPLHFGSADNRKSRRVKF